MAAHLSHSGRNPADQTGWRRFVIRTSPIGLALLLPACTPTFRVHERTGNLGLSQASLTEAAAAWGALRKGRLPEAAALAEYNRVTLAASLEIRDLGSDSSDGSVTIAASTGPLSARVVHRNVVEPECIHELVPAEFLKVKRGFDRDTSIKGVGTSLIAHQKGSETDPFLPETGLWYPVTAILNLDEPSRPLLELHDPSRAPGSLNGRAHLPFSASYTTALARDYKDRQFLYPKLPSFLKFEKFAHRLGAFRLTPFDPEKEVCLFVHGIYSTPLTWHETINDLLADPAIRERYEFWSFGYPTGAAIPYLAAELRRSIAGLQEFRSARGARTLELTVVGHSMGGLLAKSITQRGGDTEWGRICTVPIEQVDLNDEARELVRRLVYYEPVTDVKKVIFCATPHRGSAIAEKSLAKAFATLIQMPLQLSQVAQHILQNNREVLTPLGIELITNNATSIAQLRPNSPLVSGFFDKPLNPGVKYYSVIGNNSPPEVPLTDTTDGVVEYASSHLEGVISEDVISPSEHGVHLTPAGIEAIRRILAQP